jgi:hypothetical protein
MSIQQIIDELDHEIANLTAAREALITALNGSKSSSSSAPVVVPMPTKRTMTQAQRDKLSRTMKARWAKSRKGDKLAAAAAAGKRG